MGLILVGKHGVVKLSRKLRKVFCPVNTESKPRPSKADQRLAFEISKLSLGNRSNLSMQLGIDRYRKIALLGRGL